jgi:soluble lytic murein transglycosylase-like protein
VTTSEPTAEHRIEVARRIGDRRVAQRRQLPRDAPERRRGVDRRKAAGGFLAFVSLLLAGTGSEASARRPPRAYRGLIDAAAMQHGVSPAVVEAVMAVESSFNPRALSHKGAIGLMQLMPDTATRFGVKDAYDPAQNILGGTKYLSFLLKLFGGDIDLACAAYNAGEQAVQRHGGIPPYRETRQYVEKIRRRLGQPAMASAAAPVPTPKPDFIFYTWTDAKGVLNVSQFPPPAGQAYQKRRLR